MRDLASILATALRGGRPSNVFIYGKPGTGKTCVTKFVLQKLERKIQESPKSLSLLTVYINCKEVGSTNYSVYLAVAGAIDQTLTIPATGLPTSEVYNRLLKVLDGLEDVILTIVLDEIDELVKKSGSEVLYSLTRVNQHLPLAQVSIIGISNDTKFKDYLDARVYSSLSEEEIVFTPYNATELIDILQERSEKALHPQVMMEGVVQKIAAIAAREHGDARRALDLLRVAAELAERQGLDKVCLRVVDEAKNHIERNTAQEVIRTLPLQSKVVMAAIYQLEKLDRSDVTSGLIYEVYCELCQTFHVDKLSARRVGDYINELDVLGIVEAKLVSKGRYGRTKRVNFALPKSLVREVLAEDSYLDGLFR